MSLGEILRVGAIDTALGMGTVFAILIFISICIWLLGLVCRDRKKVPAADPAPAAAVQNNDEDPGIDPEIIAVITAAIHQHMKDEMGEQISSDEYIVRKVRRATWKHTS